MCNKMYCVIVYTVKGTCKYEFYDVETLKPYLKISKTGLNVS